MTDREIKLLRENCGFQLVIRYPRACEASNKNVFMQIANICDFSVLPRSSFLFPFTQFLIIYSFEGGKKRNK